MPAVLVIDFEKSIGADDLLRIVQEAQSRIAVAPAEDPEAHAAARWAAAVLPIVRCERDPKTLTGWSRCAAASPGTLKGWCAAAGVSPRRSLVLGRLLRAVVQRGRRGHRVQDLLDVVDKRTLAGLLRLGGVASGNPDDLPADVDRLLETQDLVRDPRALAELRRRLRPSDPPTLVELSISR
jgi:hypothetical protein